MATQMGSGSDAALRARALVRDTTPEPPTAEQLAAAGAALTRTAAGCGATRAELADALECLGISPHDAQRGLQTLLRPLDG